MCVDGGCCYLSGVKETWSVDDSPSVQTKTSFPWTAQKPQLFCFWASFFSEKNTRQNISLMKQVNLVDDVCFVRSCHVLLVMQDAIRHASLCQYFCQRMLFWGSECLKAKISSESCSVVKNNSELPVTRGQRQGRISDTRRTNKNIGNILVSVTHRKQKM